MRKVPPSTHSARGCTSTLGHHAPVHGSAYSARPVAVSAASPAQPRVAARALTLDSLRPGDAVCSICIVFGTWCGWHGMQGVRGSNPLTPPQSEARSGLDRPRIARPRSNRQQSLWRRLVVRHALRWPASSVSSTVTGPPRAAATTGRGRKAGDRPRHTFNLLAARPPFGLPFSAVRPVQLGPACSRAYSPCQREAGTLISGAYELVRPGSDE